MNGINRRKELKDCRTIYGGLGLINLGYQIKCYETKKEVKIGKLLVLIKWDRKATCIPVNHSICVILIDPGWYCMHYREL